MAMLTIAAACRDAQWAAAGGGRGAGAGRLGEKCNG